MSGVVWSDVNREASPAGLDSFPDFEFGALTLSLGVFHPMRLLTKCAFHTERTGQWLYVRETLNMSDFRTIGQLRFGENRRVSEENCHG